eukprot:UC4_evm1s425
MTDAESDSFLGFIVKDMAIGGEENTRRCAELRKIHSLRRAKVMEAKIVNREDIAGTKRKVEEREPAHLEEEAEPVITQLPDSQKAKCILDEHDERPSVASTPQERGATEGVADFEAAESPKSDDVLEPDAVSGVLGFTYFCLGQKADQIRKGLALKRPLFSIGNGEYLLADYDEVSADEPHPRLWRISPGDEVWCRYEAKSPFKRAAVVRLQSSSLFGSKVEIKFIDPRFTDSIMMNEEEVRERLWTIEQARFIENRQFQGIFSDMMWELRKRYLMPKTRGENIELEEEIIGMAKHFGWKKDILEKAKIIKKHRNHAQHIFWKKVLDKKDRNPKMLKVLSDEDVKFLQKKGREGFCKPDELKKMREDILRASFPPKRHIGSTYDRDKYDKLRHAAWPHRMLFEELMWDLRMCASKVLASKVSHRGEKYIDMLRGRNREKQGLSSGRHCRGRASGRGRIRGARRGRGRGRSRGKVTEGDGIKIGLIQELRILKELFEWNDDVYDEARGLAGVDIIAGEKNIYGRNYFEHDFERDIIKSRDEGTPPPELYPLKELKCRRERVLKSSAMNLDSAAHDDPVSYWLNRLHNWKGC